MLDAESDVRCSVGRLGSQGEAFQSMQLRRPSFAAWRTPAVGKFGPMSINEDVQGTSDLNPSDPSPRDHAQTSETSNENLGFVLLAPRKANALSTWSSESRQDGACIQPLTNPPLARIENHISHHDFHIPRPREHYERERRAIFRPP